MNNSVPAFPFPIAIQNCPALNQFGFTTTRCEAANRRACPLFNHIASKKGRRLQSKGCFARRRGASIGGYRGAAGLGVYSSTKFAVEGLCEALHDELAPLGIHVTVVEPSYFRTDFLDSSSLWVSGNIIGDYAETVGKVRTIAAGLSHNQPGDPQKAGRGAHCLYRCPQSAGPPAAR